MINHILNNIKSLLKKELLFVMMLIFIQLISVIVIFSSYGIINHYNTKTKEVEGSALHFGFECSESKYCNEEIYSFYGEILPKIERKLDRIFVLGFCGKYRIQSSAGYKNNKYIKGSFYKNLKEFSDETYDKQLCEVIVSEDLADDSIVFGNEEYKTVGIHPEKTMREMVCVPFTVLPYDARYDYISFFLTVPLTESEYNFISESMERNFGGRIHMPEFDGIPNESEYRVYKNMILIIAAMVLMCGINYCIIYQYLIEQNKKSFAVLRICGCTRGKAMAGYLFEMLTESLLLFLIGAVIFYNAVYPVVNKYFEYAQFYYDKSVNVYFMVIYLAVLFLIYFIQVKRFVKESPSALIKEV